MASKLLAPCPFCGSRALDATGWAVECENCGASGPLGKGSNAVELWERRDSAFVQAQLQNPHIALAPHDM